MEMKFKNINYNYKSKIQIKGEQNYVFLINILHMII
jgi:hypothetical protein